MLYFSDFVIVTVLYFQLPRCISKIGTRGEFYLFNTFVHRLRQFFSNLIFRWK